MAAIALSVHADDRTRKLAERLPAEASSFAREAVQLVADEKLYQKALGGEKERTIVSQYGFVSFRQAPEALREFRDIQTVDGKAYKSAKSLKALAAAVSAADDRQKQRAVDELQKAGLSGFATELGQLLLLFNSRKVQNYDFSFESQRFVGADRTMIFGYSQIENAGASGSMTVIQGKNQMRPKLSGRIWVDGDYRPLKITLATVSEVDHTTQLRQEIEVTYTPTTFRCVLPTSAHHREFKNETLNSDTEYSYTNWRPWSK